MFRTQSTSQRRVQRVAAMLSLLVLLVGLFATPASAQVAAQSAPTTPVHAPAAMPTADPGTVTFMRDLFGSRQIAVGDQWLIGGGYLYWAQCDYFNGVTGYLRRWPLRGSIRRSA